MASIDRRPNGKYRARWREYPGGPQKTRSFARKLGAERFLTDVQHRLNTGSYVDPAEGRITLADHAGRWLERQPWRHATEANARKALAHIVPELGDRPLASIRKGDVQAFVSGLDLSPGYVRRIIYRTLSAVLESAVDDGLIVRNVAKGVKLPADTAREIVPPTLEQVAAIYDASAAWFRPAVTLGAGLGLRQAEASGLTVDRVVWLDRSVRVDRQWMSRQSPSRFGPPKSRSSDRTIPASSFVLDELANHVGRRHEGFVLHRSGEPVDHNAFGHQWRQATKRAGVEGMRYHDLRHAFASMLISAGCSVRAVSAALGHSSAAITLNLYSHLWPGDEDRIRAAVDEAFALRAEDSLRTSDHRS